MIFVFFHITQPYCISVCVCSISGLCVAPAGCLLCVFGPFLTPYFPPGPSAISTVLPVTQAHFWGTMGNCPNSRFMCTLVCKMRRVERVWVHKIVLHCHANHTPTAPYPLSVSLSAEGTDRSEWTKRLIFAQEIKCYSNDALAFTETLREALFKHHLIVTHTNICVIFPSCTVMTDLSQPQPSDLTRMPSTGTASETLTVQELSPSHCV